MRIGEGLRKAWGLALELTGAVWRRFADRFAERLSVMDFGAIADGTLHTLAERYATLAAAQADYPFAKALTDSIDRCAIQAAYNAAAARTNARRVYHPAGHYVIDSMLWLWDRLDMYGEGAATFIENVNDGSVSPIYQALFGLGYYGTGGTDDIGMEFDFEQIALDPIAAGADSFVVTNALDVAKFAEGDIVLLYQNGANEVWGGKRSYTTLEAARVEAIDVPTKTVTLDRPLYNAQNPALCSISGRAGVRLGSDVEPAGHVLKVIDRVRVRDMALSGSSFASFGYVYDSVFERLQVYGPYGFSADFVCESEVRYNRFTSGVRLVELALRSHGTRVHHNRGVLDTAYIRDAAIAPDNTSGLWVNQGAYECDLFGNRMSNDGIEWAPIMANLSARDCRFRDNDMLSRATTILRALADITLAAATNIKVYRNTFRGGNKFYVNINAAVAYEIARNHHLAPLVAVEQGVTFQAGGVGSSGRICGNVYEGNLTYDYNGIGAAVLDAWAFDNHYTGTVTNTSTHPNFAGNHYGFYRSFLRGDQAFVLVNDGAEHDVFSHTIGAQAKKFSRWRIQQIWTDTGVPTTNKTVKLKVDGVAICTVAIPSAFGRAYNRIEALIESRNDGTLQCSLMVRSSPFAAGGTCAVYEQFATVATTNASAHQFKLTMTAAATAPCSVNQTYLSREAVVGGAWAA